MSTQTLIWPPAPVLEPPRSSECQSEPYLAARLWLLGRLQSGPITTLELRTPPWRASQNPAQRVLELRNGQHDIRTERAGGLTWYRLWLDGEPVGSLPE